MATTSDDATKAARILREAATRTPAEQAAIDYLDQNRWILWHANDYSLGVIRLLSNADLLRDKAYEQNQEAAAKSFAGYAERKRAAHNRAIRRLGELAQAAADRLNRGDSAAEVAGWLRETQGAIGRALEAEERAALSAPKRAEGQR